tara:strand:+ start:441 stop:815 length:375 start_codon:yes stop_codon:yes gene_type:complete
MTEKTDVSGVDIDFITDSITNIMETLLTEEYQQLKKNNVDKLLLRLEKEFPKFSEKYYSLLKLIVKGEDISYLFKMLEMIESVQKNEKNIVEVEKNLGEELAEKYLYPSLSKKEVKNIKKKLNK